MAKKFITKPNQLDKIDWVLILGNTILFTVFFILGIVEGEWNEWQLYVSFIANLINIVNLILTIKRKIANVYFGFVSAILLGAIAFDKMLVGTIVRYWGIAILVQIVTLVSWLRASKDKKTVEIVTGNWKFFWILFAITIVIVGLFTWMETTDWWKAAFHTGDRPWYECLFDVLPFVMLLSSTICLVLRYKQYWILIFLSAPGIFLWIYLVVQNPYEPSNWQMLFGNVLNILFAIKGYFEWSKDAKSHKQVAQNKK